MLPLLRSGFPGDTEMRSAQVLRVVPIVAALAAVLGAPASAPLATAQELDLEAFPASRVSDLPDTHRRWLERDVRWIVTEDERDIFLRLPDDARRDAFIERFWEVRDPTPGTASNEFREQHYERLAYATRVFARGATRPGYLTDRGRVWILLGEPRTVSQFPNTQLAWPVESWFYNVDPGTGLPAFFYVAFFRERGIGDYRLYSPVNDGPEALLNPAGESYATQVAQDELHTPGGRPTPFGDLEAVIDTLEVIDQELARVALNLIPGEGAGPRMSPVRSEMLLGQIFDLPYRVMPDAGWAVSLLTGETESAVRFETLPLEVEAVGLIDAAGQPFVHYAMRTAAHRLNLQPFQDPPYLTYALDDSLTDPQDRVLDPPGRREAELQLVAAEATRLRDRPVTLLERRATIPGSLTLGVLLENNVTREFGRATVTVDVPAPDPDAIRAGRPFLVAEHEDLGPEHDELGPHYPYQLGRNFVLPALDGPFASGGTLWVFHQIYAPASAREGIGATYALHGAVGGLAVSKRSVLPLSRKDRHGVLNQLTGLSLVDVAPGEYRLRVSLEGIADAEWSLPVRVVAADEWSRPLVQAEAGPSPFAAELSLTRARQYRTVGDVEAALAAARAAYSRQPESEAAVEILAEVLVDAGRLAEMVEILTPRLAQRPNDPTLLLPLADAASRLGQHRDAIRYWERARIAGVEETPELLNLLAGEYLAEEETARALEIFDRSLALEPGQPRIRELVERLRAR